MEEHRVKLEPADSGDEWKLKRYQPQKFTLRYEADANRLVIKGKGWSRDGPYYFPCEFCVPITDVFIGSGTFASFNLSGGRFLFAGTELENSAGMITGTCTKF